MARNNFETPEVTFYTAGQAVANAGQNVTVSNVVDVMLGDYALIRVSVTGVASSTDVVTFDFVATCGKGSPGWPATFTFQVPVTMAGAVTVTKEYIFDCRGYSKVKIIKIANADATYSASACNATMAQKYE
jgi:hypothetical protein